jgi:prolipoprotein diacylglyceryltransferase
MFPYFDTDHWPVRPFGILVGIAIITGYLIGLKRFARQGIGRERFSELALWVTLGGLFGGHLFKLAYVPRDSSSPLKTYR